VRTDPASAVCYYPRANQIYFRGLGLLTELPPVAAEE
jgi:hypothetical protein